jgi:diguanylate cyclase (GGDEF)-like protein/PAS domain S-box-containing protein
LGILRMNRRRLFYSLPVILLLIVLVAGWFATDYLGNKARQEIIGESQASVLTVSMHVSSAFTPVEGAVKSLAGSPWIAPALMSKRDQDIERANSVLDRYNSALNASVSYLMAADGMTVASSNRNDPDSFVGKSYRFRPYFQEAVKGRPNRYFALGVTSGKRGFYANYPVQNHPGKVLGVVTMKKDLDDMEDFFSLYPFCFLISPDGIIFLSSLPAMVLKTLWPLDKAVQERLIASRQFGDKVSGAVFKKEIADGTEVTLDEKDYFISRKVIDSYGWSVVLLTPTDRIRIYRLIGILATISVCLLIVIFTGILYVADRSNEVIRQSEESKRLLLNAVGDGIFGIDATGQFTFVNPSTLRMLGFPMEEMLGQRVHALIHHSRTDGSNYPVEDCPMYTSHTKATECHVKDEVFWRKDGSSFPVEYSSMPTTKDGKVMGAVVAFRDITARRQAEEKLQKSETLLKEAQHLAHIGHWELDPAIGTPAWSEEIFHVFGLDPAQGEPSLEDHRKIIHPDDWDMFNNAITQSGIEGAPFDIEFRIVRPDKGIRWMHAKGYVTRDNEGKIVRLFGTAQDITERKHADTIIQESEERYRMAIERSNDGVALVEGDQHIYVNQKFLDIFGYEKPEDILGKSPFIIVHPDDREMVLEHNRKRQRGEPVPSKYEFKGITKDGTNLFIEVSAAKITYHGKPVSLAYLRDMTERKHMEEKLHTMSLTDELTGLYNRRGFFTLARQQMKITERTRKDVLLFFADLDKFKHINDTLGHQEGDKALIEAATILKEVFRESDIIGRMGGDEFAVLAINTSNETREVLAKRLHDTLDIYNKPGKREYRLSLSIGIAHYDPEEPSSLDELMTQADTLMYEDKRGK